MRLFFGGGSKKPAAPAASSQSRSENLKAAIDKNNTAIENLDKRQRFLEKKVADMEQKARDLARAKNKRGALEALKRKKMLSSELETLSNAKMTLEQQVINMEAAQTQAAAVSALAQGVKAQKNLQEGLNIDQVDQVMEEMQELQDTQNEIAQCFQTGTMDDDDLLEEFESLQADNLEQELLKTEQNMIGTAMTNVPQHEAAKKQPAQASKAGGELSDDEEAELAALQARLEMA